ncbi:MAG: aminotransferase class I/II-fold pyridoxal phosphate-dependent enzyme, partial [Pedobacter sp.]
TLLLLCNPHNPVGRVWTKEELEKIALICSKNNVAVISDEVYADLSYHHTHLSCHYQIQAKCEW